MGINVKGADISDEALSYVDDIDIKICDLEANGLPYDNDSFDIIYSKSFIEHLSKPEIFLNEAYRVLKKGGLLLTFDLFVSKL